MTSPSNQIQFLLILKWKGWSHPRYIVPFLLKSYEFTCVTTASAFTLGKGHLRSGVDFSFLHSFEGIFRNYIGILKSPTENEKNVIQREATCKRHNGPFARFDHMVQNHSCWNACCTVGLPEQSNSFQFTLTCLTHVT